MTSATTTPGPPRCREHPEREAQAACAHCGFPCCASCLVEFLGASHCGNCRDARLQHMQHAKPGSVGGATFDVVVGALATVLTIILLVSAFRHPESWARSPLAFLMVGGLGWTAATCWLKAFRGQ